MISIAMATYNGEKYIKEQLDSIFSQTIQDFELVIVDDCSKDDTFQILKDYKAREKRIRLYQNEHNLGFVNNFQKILSLCRGDYIALCDQDDIWTCDHLSVLLTAIQKENVSLVCARSVLVDKDGKDI